MDAKASICVTDLRNMGKIAKHKEGMLERGLEAGVPS